MSIQDIPYILSSQERLDHIGDKHEDLHLAAATELAGHSKQGPTGEYYHPLATSLTSPSDKADDETGNSNEVYEQGLCGIGGCQPRWSQYFANLNAFVVMYGIAGLWMITLSALIGSQVTSIERHLGLTSSKTGMVLSSNEVGYLVAVIFGSHLGKYTHIPRCLSISGIVFGLATLAMSAGRVVEPKVWQEMTKIQNTTGKQDTFTKYLCEILPPTSNYSSSLSTNNSYALENDQSGDTNTSTSSIAWAFWLLILFSVIGGAVKSYRLPLLTYYIESNIVNKNRSGLLLGISFTAMLFGPPIALFLGGYISSLPVDLKETSISKYDQRWVGAWWLGFVIIGLASVVTSIPIMFFPRHLRIKKSPDVSEPDDKASLREMFIDLPKSSGRIFRRPIFVLSLVFVIIEGFAFAGWFAFSQKYVETQFNKTSQEVSTITGVISLFSVVLGTFTGGFLTTKLKLQLRGCALITLVVAGVTVLIDSLNLVFGCSNSNVVGMAGGSTLSMEMCGCNDDIFMVCGDNNINYISPCAAGCTNSTGTTFTNCTEINNGQARSGLCDLNCGFFIPYMVLYFCGNFLGTASIVPGFLISIRAVEHRDQSLASGTASFCQTLIGMLPSPIVFGRLIDSTCSLWSSGGNCMLYDREQFRFRYQGLSIGLRFASVVVMAILLWLTHLQKRKEHVDDNNKK